jgi:hypothetical protein
MEQQKTRLERFKEGVAMITPLQSLSAQQKGNWVMLVGLLCGIVVMAFKISQFWWIEIILGAGTFNQLVTMLGIQQKINLLKKMEAGQ